MKNLLFRILSWFKQLTKLRKAFVIIALVIALHWVYMILLILFFPPIATTQINSIFEGYSLQRDYVCIDQISPEAALAVLAAEDQTFMNHFGIFGKTLSYMHLPFFSHCRYGNSCVYYLSLW